MSMPENILRLQKEVRENASDLQDYLRGLNSWEEEIRKKDKTFDEMKPKNGDPYIPAVRNSKPQKKKTEEEVVEEKPKRLKSYDYRSWDKLNVDRMLDDIDTAAEKSDEIRMRKKEEEYNKDMLTVAAAEKTKGNEHFKGGRYGKAVECYTKGMKCDETNAILPANRAMAYLKLEKFVETEADCTLSLSLDPTYVKAYLRRGVARTHLGKVESAVRDFNDALKLEPTNQQVKLELEKIKQRNVASKPDVPESKPDKKSSTNDDPAIVKPIYKPVNQRSKKPLLRIPVQDVGLADVKKEKPKTSLISPLLNRSSVLETSSLQHEIKLDHKQPLPPATKPLIEEVNSETIPKTNKSDTKLKPTRKMVEKMEEVALPYDSNTSAIPTPPNTCFQFQSDVKKLKENSGLLFKYLKQLQPSHVPMLIKDQLDTNTLMSIVKSFKDNMDQHIDFVKDFLRHLSTVKRFHMAIMFLSSADKTILQGVFRKLASENGDKEIINLSKKYGLSVL